MTFWETIERGEYVMFALAALFIASVCIWLVRSAKLGKQIKSYPRMMLRVRDHITEGDIDNALQICSSYDTPGARMVEGGLKHVGRPMDSIKTVMSGISSIEKDEMAQGESWLKAIAIISPLLGLGGTLIGMIDRLRDLGAIGESVDTATLCASLAPTIVTTVAGLGVGIFAIFAQTCLDARIDSSRRGLDKLNLEFTDLLNEPS